MTAPGSHSAGTVFLNVVPSFRNVQKSIGQQAEKIGAEAGQKAGKRFAEEFDKAAKIGRGAAAVPGQDDAGKRAGEKFAGDFRDSMKRVMAGSRKDLGQGVNSELDRIFARLESLGKQKIGVDLDAEDALDELTKIHAQLRVLQANTTLDVEVRSNVGQAAQRISREIARVNPIINVKVVADEGAFATDLKATIRKASAALPDIEIDADTSPADRKIAEIKAKMAAIGDARIGVDISAKQALAEVDRLQEQLRDLARSRVNIQVTTDANRARAELAGLSRAARQAASNGDQGANAFRAFNGVLLAVVTIGAIAIPVLAGISAALVAMFVVILPLVAAIGVLSLGLLGLGDALSASSDAQRAAAGDARDSGRTMRLAANGVRDATTSLARAREDAARSAEDAAERVEDAERDLIDAQRDAIDAQNDLVEARERAVEQIEDMRLRLRGGALAERQAVIDLFQATVTNTNTQADPAATNLDKEQASINLDQAQLQLEQIRLENGRLAEQQEETSRTGVEGTEEVIRAQQDAADSQRRVEDAVRSVERAYRDQARSAVDSAQQISDAQLNLADAQAAYADAVYQTSVAGSAAQQRLREAQEGLGPAALAFVAYIETLKPFFTELRMAAQEGFLPGLQSGIQSFMASSGDKLLQFVSVMSEGLGNLARRAGEAFGTPVWQEFFDFMTKYGPIFLDQFGSIFGNVATGLASLFVAFAPFAEDFGNVLVAGTQAFADWAAGLADSEGFKQFMDYLYEILPKVGDFLGALFGAVGNLAVALAPFATDLLDVVTNILRFIAGMDPALLRAITLAIFGIVLAFQALSGVTVIIRVLGSVLLGIFSPIGLIVAGLVLLGTAFVILWQNSETFRDVVMAVWDAVTAAVGAAVDWFVKNVLPTLKDVWEDIAAGAQWMWEHVLQPIFSVLGEVAMAAFAVIGWAWEHILSPVLSAIISVVSFLWDFIIKPIFLLIGIAFAALAAAISFVWNVILEPIFTLLGGAISWLWEHVVEPVVGWISDAWSGMSEGMNKVWDEHISPIFDKFGEAFDYLQELFGTISNSAQQLWYDISRFFVRGINGVVDVINFFLDAVNSMAEVLSFGAVDSFNLHLEHMGYPDAPNFGSVPLPDIPNRPGTGYALGGVVAGYGGIVPGFGSGDIVPTMLEPGEIVIRKWIASPFRDFLLALNAGQPEALQAAGGRNARGPGAQRFQKGGTVATAQAWARENSGRPYVWGGVGPHGWDCSGWMSDIANFLLGTEMHKRRFATGSMAGGVNAGGFLRGDTSAFTIGVTPNSHTAGTLGLLNVESGGGHGGIIGPPALGSNDKFTYKYYLPGITQYLDQAKALADQHRMPAKSNVLGMMEHIGNNLMDGIVGWIGGIESGDIKPTLYDQGGVLPPGLSMILNNTRKPESVFNDRQLQDLLNGKPTTTALVGGDVNFPITDANPVAVVDELFHKLRVMRTAGRYGEAVVGAGG